MFAYVYLDLLWKKYEISFEKVNHELNMLPEGWWDKIENSTVLEIAASKRNRKMHYIVAAQKYYIIRQLEKAMLEKEFADSIFHTFSNSSWNSVLPNLPTLYFYAGRRGLSNPPWFLED